MLAWHHRANHPNAGKGGGPLYPSLGKSPERSGLGQDRHWPWQNWPGPVVEGRPPKFPPDQALPLSQGAARLRKWGPLLPLLSTHFPPSPQDFSATPGLGSLYAPEGGKLLRGQHPPSPQGEEWGAVPLGRSPCASFLWAKPPGQPQQVPP